MLVDIIRAAVLRAEGSHIDEATSGDTQISREMLDLSTEVAIDIMRSHDWRDLVKVHGIPADGVTAAFPKPADYDRMIGRAHDDDINGYRPMCSVDEWIDTTQGNYSGRGGWILLGGMFQFHPAPSGPLSFPYVSNHFVRLAEGTLTDAFTADDNEFMLDDRLLTLGLIWRWKAQKGLDYSEDMATYEIALSQAQARDKGHRRIERRVPRIGFGTPTIAIAADGNATDTDYVAIYQQAQQ